MSDWKPIETVPTDGTVFIIYQPKQRALNYERTDHFDVDKAMAVGYINEWGHFEISHLEDHCHHDVSRKLCTHWMHLPNPPVQS